MLKEERQRLILDRLRREGRLVATQLAGSLGVSEDTIRRDLDDLALAGRVERVHGGALARSEESRDYRSRLFVDAGEKEELARAAAGLIQEGMVVLMDGGTTGLRLAHHLPQELKATVVTNNLALALSFSERPAVRTIILGGQVDGDSGSSLGSQVVAAVRDLRADLAIVGLCALRAEEGLFCESYEEAFLKRAMLETASRRAGLAVSARLGLVAAFPLGPLGLIDILITGSEAPAEVLAPFRRRAEAGGLDLILV